MENNPQDADQAKYLDNAIRAVQQKKPLPEIDFTLHTMEDGSQVSTMERVCKGTFATPVLQLRIVIACTHATDFPEVHRS
jgi:serine/threonine-protein phosphatase 2B catalytic subunit